MEIGEQQLKTILTEQREEYQRYTTAIFEELRAILKPSLREILFSGDGLR